VIELLGNPVAVTLAELTAKAGPDLYEWLRDRKNRRAIAHRLENCGYSAVHNPDAGDGRWRINESKHVVWARRGLHRAAQVKAVRDLQARRAAQAEEKKREAEERAATGGPGCKGPPKWR
jgi:hypothetical protein